MPLPFDLHVRPRPRSVVACAEQRQLVSTILLVSLPVIAVMTAPFPVSLRLLLLAEPALLVVALFAWDVATLVGALRARRRMLRGGSPVRTGVDYGIGPDVWVVTVRADDPYRAQDRRALAARGSPGAAARALAGILLRRTCGVALLGLTAMGFTFCGSGCPSHVGTTHTALNSIRSATILYMNSHPGRCPSVEDLKADGLLERSFSTKDSWGNRWEVRCEDDDVIASTAGPDRKTGTADDVVIPPPQ